MSDDYPAFYNAWESVFGPVLYHILCVWHVKLAWGSYIRTVKTPLKKAAVLLDLSAMQEEMDEKAFQILLRANVKKFLVDPDTHEFGRYLETHYSHRPKQWAGCYRKGAKLNTNMTVERWHNDLKYYSDFDGKVGIRLDTAITSLMNSLQKKTNGKGSIIGAWKTCKKASALRQRHVLSEAMPLDTVMPDGNQKIWHVPSTSRLEIYSVEQIFVCPNATCNLKCTVCNHCIHEFVCSYPDSRIMYNMCKHVHLVCRLINATNEIVNAEKTLVTRMYNL